MGYLRDLFHKRTYYTLQSKKVTALDHWPAIRYIVEVPPFPNLKCYEKCRQIFMK